MSMRTSFFPPRARCEVTDELLSLIDILVDGPFIEEKKSLRLRFRGSSNQRIIDLAASRAEGKTVLCARLQDRIKTEEKDT